MVTLKLLLWIVFIGLFVVWSVYNIRRGNRPFYLLENIIKGFVFIIYGAFIWDSQSDMRTVNLLLWCATSWWILFDIATGVILHGNPLYIGKSSGWIDRLGVKYPWGYWALKLLALYVLIKTTVNFYTQFS
jgi:hypothetical protein